jgi:hypothetical protein
MKQFVAGVAAVLIAQKVLNSKVTEYLAVEAAKSARKNLFDVMTYGLEKMIYGEKQHHPIKQTSYASVPSETKEEELKKVPRKAVEIRRHNGTEESAKRFAHWVNSKDLAFEASPQDPKLYTENSYWDWTVSFMKDDGDYYRIEANVWVSYENQEFHILEDKDLEVMFEDA